MLGSGDDALTAALLSNNSKTLFDSSSDEEINDGLGGVREQCASENGPARGLLVDPDKASEEWGKMPANFNIFGCCQFRTTQQVKVTLYFFLLVLIMFLSIGTDIATNAFVARIGQRALNAKNSIDNLFLWVQFVETLLVSGLTARIAVSRANGQLDQMRQRIVAGLIIALAYGVFAGGALLCARQPLFAVANVSSDEGKLGESYFIAKALFLPFSYAVFACSGIIYGLYDLPVFVLIVGFGTLLQILGTYLLIFVFSFGLLSDAIMSGISSVIVTAVCLMYLSGSRFSRKNGFSLIVKPPGAPFVSKEVILSFGIDNFHLFIYDLSVSASVLLLVPLAARISPDAETATSLLNSLSSIPINTASGFTLGINMIGSIFVARKAYDRLRALLRRMALTMGFGFLLLAVCVLGWPRQVTALLLGKNESTEIFDESKSSLILFTLSLPALAIMSTFEGVMYATMRFRTLSTTGVVGMLTVFIPLTVAGSLEKSLFLLVSAGVGFIFFRAIVYAAIYFFVIWPKQRAERDRIRARIARHSINGASDH